MKRRPSFPAWLIGAAATAVVVGAVATGLTLAAPGPGPTAISSSPLGPAGTRVASSTPAAPASGATGLSSSPSTTVAGATRATAAGRPATTTTIHRAAPPTPTSATTAAPATVPPPVNPGPSPAAPGTYRYRQAGSLAGTPAEGSLVVTPASPSGTQTWARVVGGPIAPSVTVMLFNASGAFLAAPGGSVSGAQTSCSFPTPLPWPVWPTTVGRSISGHADCTGSVSSYQVTALVQGTATLPLDSRSVATAVVVNTIVMAGSFSGSPLSVTLTETDYYAPTLRVPVEVKTHIAGSVMGLSVTTDRTDTLESATPS